MSKLRGAPWGSLLALTWAPLMVGCAGGPTPEPIAPTSAYANAAYYVSIKDSPDVQKKIDETCTQKHAEDAAAKASCVQTATQVSGAEGMRFVKGADQRWAWVNFGTDASGKEIIYNYIPFNILADAGPSKLSVRPAGPDKGIRPAKTLPNEIIFDLPDAWTVMLLDPVVGSKVVYRRKAE